MRGLKRQRTRGPSRVRRSRGSRRAWVITVVIGVSLLLVSAIVFAISSGTRRITTHAQALHLADDSLRVSQAARAQLGFGTHLAAVEREFGTDTSDDLDVSLAEAQKALDRLGDGLIELAERGGRFDGNLATAYEEFDATGREIIRLLGSGQSEQAEILAAGSLGESYNAFADLMSVERDFQLGEVSSSDQFMARLGDVARFLVALLIPLAVIVIYREIVRRQQRQAELEVRLDAERAVGRARDDFVANASHEFRTPLTSIYGLAQLLEEDEALPRGAREMAEMISTEAADLSRMVEDLLTTARLEAGALTFQKEHVMTHEEVVDIVRPFNRAGLEVVTQVTPAVVRVDRLRQRQVLRNLLSNARKYGGPEVQVTGAKEGEWFVWRVSDNGDGIPKELEARLFERFIHQGTTVVVPGGVGLGLSIVKALAEGMGGTVGYERSAGLTAFIVKVPLAAPTPITHAATTGAPVTAFEVAASTPYQPGDRRSS